MSSERFASSFIETRDFGRAAQESSPWWTEHQGLAIEQRFAIQLWPEGGEPVLIRPGQLVYAGRHPANDLVLQHMSTSRFHAVIEWAPGSERPMIRDRGSQNGTWLDGGVVGLAARTLHGDEQLRFGKLRVNVELLHDGFVAPALLADDDEALVLFSDVGSSFADYAWDGPTLQRALLALEERGRTGALRVTSEDFQAELTFCLGRIVAAESPAEAEPEAVVARVLECRQGSIEFSRAFEPVEACMDLSVRELLGREKEETARYRKLCGEGEPVQALDDAQLMAPSEVGSIEELEFELDRSEVWAELAPTGDWPSLDSLLDDAEAAPAPAAPAREDDFVIDLDELDLSPDQIWSM